MRKIFTLLALILFVLSGKSQLVAWNTFGLTGYGPSPLAPTTIPTANIGSSGLIRGDSVKLSGTAGGNLWGGTNWVAGTAQNGIDSLRFVTFSVTPITAGVSFTMLDSIRVRVTATGPINFLIQSSVVPGVFTTLATYSITRPTSTSNFVLPSTPLTFSPAVVGTAITFRIVPYGATSTGGVFYIGNQSSTNHLSILGVNLLPVTLNAFTASLINNNASLNWTTSNETNFNHFAVEKSLDGTQFAPITTVEATKTGTGAAYHYTDVSKALTQQYYRLKMVDNDGAFKYSAIVMVNGKEALTVTAFPNPVTNTIVIVHPKAAKGAYIQIIGADGRVASNVAIAADAVQSSLDVSKLVKGNYTILYNNAGAVQSTKLLKQ